MDQQVNRSRRGVFGALAGLIAGVFMAKTGVASETAGHDPTSTAGNSAGPPKVKSGDRLCVAWLNAVRDRAMGVPVDPNIDWDKALKPQDAQAILDNARIVIGKVRKHNEEDVAVAAVDVNGVEVFVRFINLSHDTTLSPGSPVVLVRECISKWWYVVAAFEPIVATYKMSEVEINGIPQNFERVAKLRSELLG